MSITENVHQAFFFIHTKAYIGIECRQVESTFFLVVVYFFWIYCWSDFETFFYFLQSILIYFFELKKFNLIYLSQHKFYIIFFRYILFFSLPFYLYDWCVFLLFDIFFIRNFFLVFIQSLLSTTVVANSFINRKS